MPQNRKKLKFSMKENFEKNCHFGSDEMLCLDEIEMFHLISTISSHVTSDTKPEMKSHSDKEN